MLDDYGSSIGTRRALVLGGKARGSLGLVGFMAEVYGLGFTGPCAAGRCDSGVRGAERRRAVYRADPAARAEPAAPGC